MNRIFRPVHLCLLLIPAACAERVTVPLTGEQGDLAILAIADSDDRVRAVVDFVLGDGDPPGLSARPDERIYHALLPARAIPAGAAGELEVRIEDQARCDRCIGELGDQLILRPGDDCPLPSFLELREFPGSSSGDGEVIREQLRITRAGTCRAPAYQPQATPRALEVTALDDRGYEPTETSALGPGGRMGAFSSRLIAVSDDADSPVRIAARENIFSGPVGASVAVADGFLVAAHELGNSTRIYHVALDLSVRMEAVVPMFVRRMLVIGETIAFAGQNDRGGSLLLCPRSSLERCAPETNVGRSDDALFDLIELDDGHLIGVARRALHTFDQSGRLLASTPEVDPNPEFRAAADLGGELIICAAAPAVQLLRTSTTGRVLDRLDHPQGVVCAGNSYLPGRPEERLFFFGRGAAPILARRGQNLSFGEVAAADVRPGAASVVSSGDGFTLASSFLGIIYRARSAESPELEQIYPAQIAGDEAVIGLGEEESGAPIILRRTDISGLAIELASFDPSRNEFLAVSDRILYVISSGTAREVARLPEVPLRRLANLSPGAHLAITEDGRIFLYRESTGLLEAPAPLLPDELERGCALHAFSAAEGIGWIAGCAGTIVRVTADPPRAEKLEVTWPSAPPRLTALAATAGDEIYVAAANTLDTYRIFCTSCAQPKMEIISDPTPPILGCCREPIALNPRRDRFDRLSYDVASAHVFADTLGVEQRYQTHDLANVALAREGGGFWLGLASGRALRAE